jgi:UPF0755 protein
MKKIFMTLALLVAILCIFGFAALNDINGSSKTGTDITVSIPKGSGANTIGKILADEGVIKNDIYFKIYTKINPAKNLQYGEYTLNTSMSYDEIIKILSSSSVKRQTKTVTFPEGFSLIQFAKRMENNGLCTREEFIETANNADFSQFEFWKKIKEHPNAFMKAEGYLYPDTYEFYTDDTVYNMIEKIFANFESKITANMYDRMEELGMSLDEVINLASFVQEEAGHRKDQPYVAACLYNRIKKGSPLPRLECNVCSLIDEDGNYVYDYIVDYYGGVANVPDGMMAAYDTYTINGLPPTPISNPGIDAIKNTLWPAEDFFDYYYFVTDSKGKYYYAKTYDEHLANVRTAYRVK